MKQITKCLSAITLAMLCLISLAACSSKDDHVHTYGEWVTVNAASCTQDGSEERTCDTCGEKETRTITATGHSFTETTVSEQTLKAAATCVTANEYYYSCACGAISDSETFFHGRALGHNYVDNVCTNCGQQEVECDHTLFHEESIDLGEYGACTAKISYMSCVCRQVNKITVEDFDLGCYIYDQQITRISEDENKDLNVRMEGTCSVCGLQMCQDMKMTADPVTGKRNCNGICELTLKKEDQVIFRGTYEGVVFGSGSNTVVSSDDYRMIDLTEYGGCEGVLFVEKDHSGCESVCDLISDCDIDLDNLPDPVVTTDANGVEHTTYTATCSKCGLKCVQDLWHEKVDDCTTRTHYVTTITCGDKSVFSSELTDTDDEHNWEITEKTFLGDTCDDGVKLTYTCSVCNRTETDIDYGHNSNSGLLKDYITTDCSCAVWSVQVCKYCNEVTGINMDFYAYLGTKENITDDDGEVIGERTSFTCPTCQMRYVIEEKTVETDSCHTLHTEHQYVYDAQGQCQLDVLYFKYERETHDCDYRYYLLGEDCADGYVMCGTCKKCNQTIMDWDDGHAWKNESVDLSGHDCCANAISARKCAICGDTYLSTGLYELGCDFGDTITDSYTDENGIVHTTTTVVCQECGLTFKSVGTSTTDGCKVTESGTTTISMGDTVFLTESYDNNYSDHDYDTKCYFAGDGCNNGVYIVRICKNCNEAYIDHHFGHDYEDEFVDLTYCGCSVHLRTCEACNESMCRECDLNPCNWEEKWTNDSGYTVYQCSNCSFVYWRKYDETLERNEYIFFTSENGEEILRFVSY